MTPQIDFKKLTLMDALDLAIYIEKEAEERYTEFADQIGNRYKGDASDFFREMAHNEMKHGDQLSAQRKKLFKDTPPRIDPSLIWDVEAPAHGTPRTYMSPRQAMEVALSSEKKAFRFFDDALKIVTDPQVKDLFTVLRTEEIEHRTMIEHQLALMPADSDADRSGDDIDEPSALYKGSKALT